MQTNFVHSLERTSTIQSYLCLITRPWKSWNESCFLCKTYIFELRKKSLACKKKKIIQHQSAIHHLAEMQVPERKWSTLCLESRHWTTVYSFFPSTLCLCLNFHISRLGIFPRVDQLYLCDNLMHKMSILVKAVWNTVQW